MAWFGFINGLIATIIGTRYALFFPFPETFLSFSYVFLATLTHFITLHYLPLVIILVPIAWITSSRLLCFSLAVIFSAIVNSLLILDTNFFAENQFHISLITFLIFESSTYWIMCLQFFIALIFEVFIGLEVFKKIDKPTPIASHGFALASVFILFWLYVQGTHIWADATYQNSITTFTRYLPMYRPIHAKRDLAKMGWIDSDDLRQIRTSDRRSLSELNYPTQELICDVDQGESLNVLLVVIDALRPDIISAEITPNLYAFKKENSSFNNHYTGGTSSRMGMFSIFYGIPTTYWRIFHDNLEPAPLIRQLQSDNYRIKAISSSGLGSPGLLDRTALATVEGINLKSLESSEKESNRSVTRQWMNHLNSNSSQKQSSFTFLHFDPPIDDVDGLINVSVPKKFNNAGGKSHQEEVAKYIESVQFVDNQIGIVLDNFSARGLDENTILIITSDHGYELNDYNTGYYGHSSNYSPAQMRVPLFIKWPGKQSTVIDHLTSHNDLPPTIINSVLGCKNSSLDFSSGHSLFDKKPWQFIVAGSYDSFAIISPEKTITSFGGYYEVRDENYKLTQLSEDDKDLIQSAMLEMKRFYK